MLTRIHLIATAALLTPWAVVAQHQTATFDPPIVGGELPYTIEIREISLAPAIVPNIHSTAAADWNGQWVFLAGRTNGLHGMTGRNAFDPAFENREVWVIDPKSKQSWHKSLETSAASGLTQDQIDALSAVNTQFYQDSTHWFIVGGYGYKRSVADHKTYNTLTKIDLPGLVDWVKAPAGTETTLAADHIDQIQDSYFQVTGGGLERIGSEFQLVFGQNYDGRYRTNFNGTYTKQIRRFTVDLSNGLSVPAVSKIATTQRDDFRRRDLNITTLLNRTAIGTYQENVAALSGVFTPDDGAWTVPVVVEPGGQVTSSGALGLEQGFQIYHCAKTGLYHRATGEMHVLLFGGITILEYDDSSDSWTSDSQAPFTNQCGTVIRRPDGTFDQYFLPARFPLILSDGKELRFGANAEFFINRDVPSLHPRVIDLTSIQEPTIIGHIFGGLVADAGNSGNTGSSGHIFEVSLTPNLPTVEIRIARISNEVSIEWESELNTSYIVERSIDLKEWVEVSLSIDGTGTTLQWQESRADPAYFYRVLAGKVSKPAQ